MLNILINLINSNMFKVVSILILLVLLIPLSKLMIDILVCINVIIALIFLFIKTPKNILAYYIMFIIYTAFLNISIVREILTKSRLEIENTSFIINSIGSFTVDENLLMGSIIFILLILVNLLLVYNGISRISSAHARFSLETFPGRIIAIESDLSNKIIDENEAKYRKEKLTQEISFNGTMDTLSRFLKGIVLFNILILIINIAAGVCIGIFHYKITIFQSFNTYVTMAIGNAIIFQSILVLCIVLFIKIQNSKERKNLNEV